MTKLSSLNKAFFLNSTSCSRLCLWGLRHHVPNFVFLGPGDHQYGCEASCASVWKFSKSSMIWKKSEFWHQEPSRLTIIGRILFRMASIGQASSTLLKSNGATHWAKNWSTLRRAFLYELLMHSYFWRKSRVWNIWWTETGRSCRFQWHDTIMSQVLFTLIPSKLGTV